MFKRIISLIIVIVLLCSGTQIFALDFTVDIDIDYLTDIVTISGAAQEYGGSINCYVEGPTNRLEYMGSTAVTDGAYSLSFELQNPVDGVYKVRIKPEGMSNPIDEEFEYDNSLQNFTVPDAVRANIYNPNLTESAADLITTGTESAVISGAGAAARVFSNTMSEYDDTALFGLTTANAVILNEPIYFSIDSTNYIDVYPIYLNEGEKLTAVINMEEALEIDPNFKYSIRLMEYSNGLENLGGFENLPVKMRTWLCGEGEFITKVVTVAVKSGTHYMIIGSRDGSYNSDITGKLTMTVTSASDVGVGEGEVNEAYKIVNGQPVKMTYNYYNDYAKLHVPPNEILTDDSAHFEDFKAPDVSGFFSSDLDNSLDVDYYTIPAQDTDCLKTFRVDNPNCELALYSADDLKKPKKAENTISYKLSKNTEYYLAVYRKDSVPFTQKLWYNVSIEYSIDDSIPSLDFKPVGGGYFISSNNPESVYLRHLADGDTPEMLYRQAGAPEGKYTLMAHHLNATHLDEDTKEPTGLGKDIFIDVMFCTSNDAQIKINKLGVLNPKIAESYVSHQAYADFSQWQIKEYGQELPTTPKPILNYPEKTFNSDNSNDNVVWLSDLYKEMYGGDYPDIPNPGKKEDRTQSSVIYIIMEFEISGSVDVNVCAYENKSNVKSNINDGRYYWDYMFKGIANSQPETVVNLEYEINNRTESGTWLPVKITNAYNPNGKEVVAWKTHTNPLEDIYAKNTATQSDLLTFRYYDGLKWGFYGAEVPADQRDADWIFAPDRSGAREEVYKSDRHIIKVNEFGTPSPNFKPNDIITRFFLIPSPNTVTNFDLALSMGNYSVVVTYNIKILNNTDSDWMLNYLSQTESNILIGYGKKDSALTYKTKGELHTERETLASFDIAGETDEYQEFVLQVILPTADKGGMNNALELIKNQEG